MHLHPPAVIAPEVVAERRYVLLEVRCGDGRDREGGTCLDDGGVMHHCWIRLQLQLRVRRVLRGFPQDVLHHLLRREEGGARHPLQSLHLEIGQGGGHGDWRGVSVAMEGKGEWCTYHNGQVPDTFKSHGSMQAGWYL